MAEVRFCLPPSLGDAAAAERARGLERFLTEATGQTVEVQVAKGYDAMVREILSGRTDAAWAPPFVCARVEAMGARVLVRGVREGASSYRSAIVARKGPPVTLESLQGVRAAWVDHESAAGYLLPMALLRARGIDPAVAFSSQTFVGSYRAALDQVARSEADIASVFAPPAASKKLPTSGLEVVAPELIDAFQVVELTEEAPNDGVAVARTADPNLLKALQRALLEIGATEEGRQLVRDLFSADGFEPAPPLGYRALYRVALSTL